MVTSFPSSRYVHLQLACASSMFCKVYSLTAYLGRNLLLRIIWDFMTEIWIQIS
jgi:hypothetical protein